MSRVHCAVLNHPHPHPRPIAGGREGKTGSQCYGGHSERETPGPIPNPEAKPLSADGTARATAWESRTSPDTTSSEGRSGSRTALAFVFLVQGMAQDDSSAQCLGCGRRSPEGN